MEYKRFPGYEPWERFLVWLDEFPCSSSECGMSGAEYAGPSQIPMVPSQLAVIFCSADRYEKGLIAAIRALGFVGNAHYCPGCMNHFHDSRGQHEDGCEILLGLNADDDWWQDVVGPPT